MKYLSSEAKHKWAKLSVTRANNNLKRKHRFHLEKDYVKPNSKNGWAVIRAPRILCVLRKKDHKSIHKFINDIKILSRKYKTKLSFANCEIMSAPALLYLYVTLESLRDNDEFRLIRVSISTANHGVSAHLSHSGMVDMLLNSKRIVDYKESKIIPVQTGTEPKDFNDIVDHIRYAVLNDKLAPENENLIGDALSEVFGNVINHAYPERVKSEKRWWAICQYYNGILYLAVYDNGVGIPSTITEDHWALNGILGDIASMLKVTTDADKIEIAMQPGKNRRKEEKHGQGSISMHALIDNDDDSGLYVFSDKGRYGKKRCKVNKSTYGEKIEGTLVEWKVRLNNE